MVDIIEDYVVYFLKRFIYNVTHAFTNMNSYRWIRLVTVVCAYFLIRPLFVKIGKKIQDRQLAKQRAADAAGVAAKAKISPNALRGLEDPADEQESGEDEEEQEADKTTSGAEWGKKARKRQRQMLKKIEEQEAKVLEDPSFGPGDKDILERLVDYKEGEDGW
jgi:flagellar biosynthesis/type III secretory pathway M-ring protein FliF/YscJ